MYINGLKYACSTCIKGHRSSHCNHTERPLFEIRKKGRPVTQCAYCRDLRKTKQIHIKCACNDKKGSNIENSLSSQYPLLIKNNLSQACSSSTLVNDVSQQDNTKCTCPANIHTTKEMEAIPMIRSSSSGSVPPTTSTQLEMPQDTLLQQAPLCPTTNEENRPYSWALITTSTPPPPSSANQDVNLSTTNNPVPFSQSSPFTGNTTDMTFNHHDYLQLGFTFHKPPSSTQRFLEGKPRLKRRSTSNSKRHQQSMSTLMMAACGIPMTMANLTIDTNSSSTSSSSASLTTPPSSTLSPEVPSFNNPNMDLQFDYLTQQLETLSSHHPDTSSLNDVEEFTTILSNILLPQVSHPTPTPTPTTPPPPPPLLSQQQQPIRSHCGSFVPLSNCCQDLGVNGGESVVITITPLLTDPSKQQTNTTTSTTTTTTTTRIVTCYCGQQCICPGCLVHPGNFLLGNDPYTGLLPSSSSSCYCSDEEDTSNKTTMIVEANTNDIFNLNNNTNYMSFSPS